MQRDQNGLVEAVALGKKKKKSPKQRTTYPHKIKLRFFWLVKETITGKKAQEGGNNVIRSASQLDLR